MKTPLANALQELMELGVEGQALVDAIARMEAKTYGQQTAKEKNAERQRRFRAKKEAARNESNVTCVSNVTSVTAAQSVSPEPPSKKPLPSPPLGGLMVSPVTAKPASTQPNGAVLTLAEQIRLLQPPKHRRASVFAISRALLPALREFPPEDVLAACRAYYAEPEQQEQNGRFAWNAGRLLDEGRYRDFLPNTHDPPAEPVTDAVQARRLQTFKDTGEWKPAWGPRPEEQAA